MLLEISTHRQSVQDILAGLSPASSDPDATPNPSLSSSNIDATQEDRLNKISGTTPRRSISVSELNDLDMPQYSNSLLRPKSPDTGSDQQLDLSVDDLSAKLEVDEEAMDRYSAIVYSALYDMGCRQTPRRFQLQTAPPARNNLVPESDAQPRENASHFTATSTTSSRDLTDLDVPYSSIEDDSFVTLAESATSTSDMDKARRDQETIKKNALLKRLIPMDKLSDDIVSGQVAPVSGLLRHPAPAPGLVPPMRTQEPHDENASSAYDSHSSPNCPGKAPSAPENVRSLDPSGLPDDLDFAFDQASDEIMDRYIADQWDPARDNLSPDLDVHSTLPSISSEDGYLDESESDAASDRYDDFQGNLAFAGVRFVLVDTIEMDAVMSFLENPNIPLSLGERSSDLAELVRRTQPPSASTQNFSEHLQTDYGSNEGEAFGIRDSDTSPPRPKERWSKT
jgi:hypothetical protein